MHWHKAGKKEWQSGGKAQRGGDGKIGKEKALSLEGG